ncbi:MAG TPA: DUF6600 domain-containing protein [Pyrinomonadaceae bacterium]|jgi:hypothetical protein
MSYKITARTLLLSILLLTLLGLTASARAAAASDDETTYDYDETARVARISLLSGDVSLRRAGTNKWEHAALNFPLVEGDRLATGPNSHVEVQIDARNFVRLGEYATLDLVTLRAEGVALSLPAGTATLRLARFDHDHEYFEIDAPKTTIAAEQRGLYRLDVAESGSVRVTVRDGARARLYSDTSGFTLRDGRTAELTYDNAGEGDWNFTAARDLDSWDRWNDDRERYLAARLKYDNRERYYDQDVWGAEELDAYGEWVNTHDYGYVWRPHTTVINNYYDWAPYRYGHWTWCPPYGWTWVGDEPWGWAPYHYGRWVYYNNYWCWAPRGYYNYHPHRSWWRPALVAFVIFGSNSDICWYPLGYHQRDPHARHYQHQQPGRLTPLGNGEVARLERINPIYQRAVTALPARDFGTPSARGRRATDDIARQAISTDPVPGRLPIRPVGDSATGNSGGGGAANTRPLPGDRPVRSGVSKLGPGNEPARQLYERPTGAAARVPGKALDEELKRERVFNNRAPRVVGTDTNSSPRDSSNAGERRTGAVARPARPPRASDADQRIGIGAPEDARPVRAPRGGDENKRPRDNDNGDRQRIERPEPAADRTLPRVERPDTPRERPQPKVERPEPKYERPEPKYERPEPARERPAPPREERQQQREERQQQREERRADPPARAERSAPREERSAPPPERSAPPPPREERSAPPPQREERHADAPREHDAPAKSPRPPTLG